MRWTVFKYKFNYKTEHSTHGPSVLEFIVSNKGKLPNEQEVEKKARAIMNDVCLQLASTSSLPMYDFGKLSKDEMLDDIRKLTQIEFKGNSVQLWFDRDTDFAFWDDGNHANHCPCGACSHG